MLANVDWMAAFLIRTDFKKASVVEDVHPVIKHFGVLSNFVLLFMRYFYEGQTHDKQKLAETLLSAIIFRCWETAIGRQDDNHMSTPSDGYLHLDPQIFLLLAKDLYYSHALKVD